jgi:hypothetical protein
MRCFVAVMLRQIPAMPELEHHMLFEPWVQTIE